MTARWLLPRVVLAALFLSGAVFAFFESVYLRDQHLEFSTPRMSDHTRRRIGHSLLIAGWKWIFRGIALGLSVSFVAFVAWGW